MTSSLESCQAKLLPTAYLVRRIACELCHCFRWYEYAQLLRDGIYGFHWHRDLSEVNQGHTRSIAVNDPWWCHVPFLVLLLYWVIVCTDLAFHELLSHKCINSRPVIMSQGHPRAMAHNEPKMNVKIWPEVKSDGDMKDVVVYSAFRKESCDH